MPLTTGADDAYFVPLGGGRYRATSHTAGPWDARHQHGGPPSALLARAMRDVAPDDGRVLARSTFELLGPVPVGELEVEAAVARPGRSVELREATMRADGREVMRARAWSVRGSQAPALGSAPPVPALPAHAAEIPLPWSESGYVRSIEWRFARGSFGEPGPAAVWTRLRHPLFPGEEPDSLTRVIVIADSGNGASAELDVERWLFINPELTVHHLRPPVGEWICLDASTIAPAGGAGLASSLISDARGPVARGAQALLVAPRD